MKMPHEWDIPDGETLNVRKLKDLPGIYVGMEGNLVVKANIHFIIGKIGEIDVLEQPMPLVTLEVARLKQTVMEKKCFFAYNTFEDKAQLVSGENE